MPEDSQTREAIADSPAGSGRIPFCEVLVVDDDPAMCRLVARILESNGYVVTTATDGSEALEMLRQDCPSFVITDWEMPILSGAEFCRLLRLEKLPHYVYVIMLTGTHTDQMVAGLSSGADDFVSKPVQVRELLARMRAATRVLELEEKLRLLAEHDPLTGLFNRRILFEKFQEEWDRSDRIGYPLSCAMMDVDFFKEINDTHGHLVGDAVLKFVAGLLKRGCRQIDVMGRYGGDEFCVLLPGTDLQGSAKWAERCRLAIAEKPFVVDDVSVPVRVTIGVAQRHEDTGTPEKLVDSADRALLAAKESGRNRVVAFEGSGEFPEGEIPAAEDATACPALANGP